MFMKSHLAMTTRQPVIQQVQGMLALLRLRAMQFYKAARNRRTIAALNEQDDYLLADIGLTRRDVRSAMAEPIWRDPTATLRRRASPVRRFRE